MVIVPPAGTMPDHGARAATTTSTSAVIVAHSPPSVRPEQPVVGVQVRPVPSPAWRARSGSSGAVGAPRHAVRRSGVQVYCSRVSRTCGTFATDTIDVELEPELDERAGGRGHVVEVQRAVGVDAHALEERDRGWQIASVEAELRQRDDQAVAGAGARALDAAVAVLRVVVGPIRRAADRVVAAGGVVRDRGEHAPAVGEQQRASARVHLPLDLGGVGEVQALARQVGVVERDVRAGVAVEIGEPQHAAAGEQVRRVLAGVEHLVPQHVVRRHARREIPGAARRAGSACRAPRCRPATGRARGRRRSWPWFPGAGPVRPDTMSPLSIDRSKSPTRERCRRPRRRPGRPRATNADAARRHA